jgi:hypothetical protein
VLKVDNKVVATQAMGHTIPFILQFDENFDVGADIGTRVDDQYQIPVEFAGKFSELTLTIDRQQLAHIYKQELQQTQHSNHVSDSSSYRYCRIANRLWPDHNIPQLNLFFGWKEENG